MVVGQLKGWFHIRGASPIWVLSINSPNPSSTRDAIAEA
ncbi:hypothetical protein QE408_001698 [Agrobacterium larrymoorei]|uniref:Uncharacterized protein n=1 Tax=Agrobacterium larrymoorei TaxID=160699 RepID=A0ABU0UI14_9HYPH|nr:hypothetical protein [Agrobacterium larrymoorei]